MFYKKKLQWIFFCQSRGYWQFISVITQSQGYWQFISVITQSQGYWQFISVITQSQGYWQLISVITQSQAVFNSHRLWHYYLGRLVVTLCLRLHWRPEFNQQIPNTNDPLVYDVCMLTPSQVVQEFRLNPHDNFSLFCSPGYRNELTRAHLHQQLQQIPVRYIRVCECILYR